MQKKIRVLDCTLRDGGQGLIDINGNGVKTEYFTNKEKIKLAGLIAQSNIDIVEIGCIGEEVGLGKSMFALYDDIESLSAFLPPKSHQEQLFAGLFIGPNGGLNRVPEYRKGLCECVRVILRYSELKKSLDFCSGLTKKGYKVFIQPMLTMRYTNNDLRLVVEAANDMNAYALYFVDSFGYMQSNDIQRLYEYYENRLNSSVNIGFHAHNNMNMAFENVKHFIDIPKERNIIVDSCIMGMGQGAGNLQTELIVNYLNKKYGKMYSFEDILEACDMLSKFKKNDATSWGYSPLLLIPAIYKTAYKYAISLQIHHGLTLKEINEVIKNMPDEFRNRYTRENMEVLVDKIKK